MKIRHKSHFLSFYYYNIVSPSDKNCSKVYGLSYITFNGLLQNIRHPVRVSLLNSNTPSLCRTKEEKKIHLATYLFLNT